MLKISLQDLQRGVYSFGDLNVWDAYFVYRLSSYYAEYSANLIKEVVDTGNLWVSDPNEYVYAIAQLPVTDQRDVFVAEPENLVKVLVMNENLTLHPVLLNDHIAVETGALALAFIAVGVDPEQFNLS